MLNEIVPLLITEKAAATLIGLSDSTLIAARFKGRPLLPFVRIGKRSIRYRLSDVHALVNGGVAHQLASAPVQGDPLPPVASLEHRVRPSVANHSGASDLGPRTA